MDGGLSSFLNLPFKRSLKRNLINLFLKGHIATVPNYSLRLFLINGAMIFNRSQYFGATTFSMTIKNATLSIMTVLC
jgi:hypothetical protein